MFQTFHVTSSSNHSADRISALRNFFEELGIDGFLVPRSDAYLGEYVPASQERLAWLTGFTGSAGTALVTATKSVLFVDGRYTEQAGHQIDRAAVDVCDLVRQPPSAWLKENAERGFRLGLDPWLHARSEVERLQTALNDKGGSIVMVDDNPIDRLWTDRPPEPTGAVTLQPLAAAGVAAQDKLEAMQTAVAQKGADAVVLTDPSSLAWTFNIRGSDVPHTPHPLARAIVPAMGNPVLLIDPDKIDTETGAYLSELAELARPADLATIMTERLGGKTVMLDPALAPLAIRTMLEDAGATVLDAADPARLPRAIKNEAELAGARQAHRQDGVAMVRFLSWLDTQEPGTVDEIAAAMKLEACRLHTGKAMQAPLKDISFDTISGSGPNGAIIHYRVTEESNRQLAAGELYLVDSGGQYVNATTDITRTVAIGAVPEEPKRFFTLVLKGMIAISRLRFPAGTRGVDIDAFARQALWQAGVDYGHGTGHGVGAYLSVHEGPHGISRRSMEVLQPGMILSNEPGYYRPGAFGIRIENLITVTEPAMIAGGEQAMLGFETLTLCPIDRRLVLTALMSAAEIEWLDAYHGQVRKTLMPLIDEGDVRAWLEAATQPLDAGSG